MLDPKPQFDSYFFLLLIIFIFFLVAHNLAVSSNNLPDFTKLVEENKMEYLNVAFDENRSGLESNGWPIGDLPDHIGLMQDDCKFRQYGEII